MCPELEYPWKADLSWIRVQHAAAAAAAAAAAVAASFRQLSLFTFFRTPIIQLV